MPAFEQGDLVRVPFPYTDRDTRQRRPALVVSAGPIGLGRTLLWVVMVTSAENPAWPGDVELGAAFAEMGLPIPSRIRPTKIATIDAVHAEPIGQISDTLLQQVETILRQSLGWS